MIETYKDFFVIEVLEDNENVRNLLSRYGLSKRLFLKYFNENNIFINGENIRKGSIVKKGDIVRVAYGEDEDGIIPIDMDLNIAYEDENLLIVNKMSNQVVHPIKYYRENTLLNGVKQYFIDKGINRSPRLVNRLDRGTEGLVIIAKNAFVDSLMSEKIKLNLIDRRYMVLLKGEMDCLQGVIDKPILKIDNEMKRIISEKGKKSVTKYKVIDSNGKYSLVEAQLLTGRSHQIRIHFSSGGNSIVSDELYGEFKGEPMYLCSYYLKFEDPFSKREIEVVLEEPLKRFKEKLL